MKVYYFNTHKCLPELKPVHKELIIVSLYQMIGYYLQGNICNAAVTQ